MQIRRAPLFFLLLGCFDGLERVLLIKIGFVFSCKNDLYHGVLLVVMTSYPILLEASSATHEGFFLRKAASLYENLKVNKLVAPGPKVAMHTPQFSVSAPCMVAIKAAVCSCLVVINSMGESSKEIIKSAFSSPGTP